MQKKMETTMMGYVGLGVRAVRSFGQVLYKLFVLLLFKGCGLLEFRV